MVICWKILFTGGLFTIYWKRIRKAENSYVSISAEKSKIEGLTFGVSQGTILFGPLIHYFMRMIDETHSMWMIPPKNNLLVKLSKIRSTTSSTRNQFLLSKQKHHT